ncbi:MAG: hypothetical protein L0196_02685 [candidate division Zixibacteria bacterium]|nr:hypothetical protein [candidate division Zixibacteria bacterium]
MRKITVLLVAAVAIAFLGFALVAFGLPKDQKAPAPAGTGTPAKTGQPAAVRPIPANPVRFDGRLNPVPSSGNLQFPDDPDYRSLAPNRIGATTVPFINVQTGTVEFGFTNNFLKPHSVHLVGGNAQVHMTYPIYTGSNTSPWTGTTADSLQSRIPLFYNSYNVGGSGALDYVAPGPQLSAVFPDLAPDDRKRALGWGGGVLNFTEAGQKVVAYGNRYIQRTDIGNFSWSFRGTGTMKDVEGTGSFTMTAADTLMNVNYTIPNTDPIMKAINESTWVATYDGEDPNKVYFNYTTDRGATWSEPIVSPMSTSWWNCVKIASNGGNTFYLTGMSNPAVPTTFWVSERPCYVKGTYSPGSGTISLGPMVDITGDFGLPAFLPIPHQLNSVLVGTTLHVTWNDWNDYNGQGFPGPGGRVWHASVASDGSVSGPHKIANINIDGRLADRSVTLFGFAQGPWGSGQELVYNSATGVLYALWSQPREEYDVNGAPTFQWDDPWAGLLANFDIYYSASNNGGIAWDNPVNFTDTKNADCSGTAGSPCVHEDYFAAYPDVVDDTIWAVAIVKRKPGFRQIAFDNAISPDPGSYQMLGNQIRLYKTPARAVVPSVRPDVLVKAPDTTSLTSILLAPRASHTVNMRIGNIGVVGFFLDSIVFDPSLDEGVGDGLLDVTHTANDGEFIDVGAFHDFTVTFDASQIPVRAGGNRAGLMRAYAHTTDGAVTPPNDVAVGLVAASVNVTTSFCLNRQVRIHSGNNVTDVGSQGSVADEAGTSGLEYNAGASDASNRFYDGGVWIANSELDAGICEADPRRVTRQIFGDDFLRCIADAELDSTPTGTGHYNLSIRSIGTDVGDSGLIYGNLWQQSTHPESSDFLVQNVKVINVSNNATIDSVAMGVCYDIDVFSDISQPARNVGGDTIILGADGRSYHLGYIAGNDVLVDTCTPNAQLYGVIVIPDPLTPPAIPSLVEPRFASIYRQTAFSYNLDCHGSGGDTLAQRWSWTGTGFYSTNGRVRYAQRTLSDRWTYEFNDSLADNDTCLDGRLWRADMGYMTIAKKVYNFPVNLTAREQVARYGLASLAAGVDTFLRGSGESYSVIHIGSITGLSGLIGSAQKATKWFWDHAAEQVGTSPLTPWLRGDVNTSRSLSGADIVATIQYIFNDADKPFGVLVPKCVPDVNGDGALSGADIVTLINGTFNAPGGVNPSTVCPLCLTSCL